MILIILICYCLAKVRNEKCTLCTSAGEKQLLQVKKKQLLQVKSKRFELERAVSGVATNTNMRQVSINRFILDK